MLDRIELFTQVASENGVNIDLSTPLNQSSDEEMAKDRELMADFLGHMHECQRLLQICESNNDNMRKIANK